ncbi:branched-chain amino acid ABC transporter permease [Hippea maritima]|uniref:ABC-type transporter, integral membrane subunit n=1 Tax=Hippea maritima (strain ATCC 700847 / DSM 10411 / MH2) TaxID=760142 RepID=F2LW42_HIPMA|nr:ABC-type transporter, integral membrane subunit [Hippea maritima DSM 10411]
METFIQYTINGIITGLIYALVAIGFNIIYSSVRIVNFAQGEFIMLGGVVEFYLLGLGWPVFLSLLVSSVFVGVVGILVYFIFIKNTKRPTELSLIILTIGISVLIRGVTMVIFGKNAYPVGNFLSFESINLANLTFSSQYLVVFFVVVFLVGILFWFFSKTLTGKLFLASSLNPLACRLFGVNVSNLSAMSFFISGLVGAIGGAVIAPISFVKYDMGLMFGLKGFAASVVGGFGNNIGAVVGGLVIGISESLAAGYVSSSYKDMVAFVVMIAVLFIAPEGIFGSKDVERV